MRDHEPSSGTYPAGGQKRSRSESKKGSIPVYERGEREQRLVLEALAQHRDPTLVTRARRNVYNFHSRLFSGDGDGGDAARARCPDVSTPPASLHRLVDAPDAVPAEASGRHLSFDSSFEGGNLQSAKSVSPPSCSSVNLEYELRLQADAQSGGANMQWFYFGARTTDFLGVVRFRIVNMQKSSSLHQRGLQPHVYSAAQPELGWQPFSCTDISYTRNNGGARKDRSTLAFSYKVNNKNDVLYFSSYPPYTYTMLNRFIACLHEDAEAARHFQCYELGLSLGQLPIPALLISEGAGEGRSDQSTAEATSAEDASAPAAAAASEASDTSKPVVAIIARQHPGEVVGSWLAQGLLRFLLGPSAAARRLRKSYVFHVVPMVNVDGVVFGNSRCTLAGIDPNRVWSDPNPILHPEVHAVKRYFGELVSESGASSTNGTSAARGAITLFLDLHGHSAKFGCFFYGSARNANIAAALFPKLCALGSRDISFEQCHWRCPRNHQSTARYVVHKQFGVRDSFTLECSLFAPVPRGPWKSGGEYFTPNRVEWIGITVGHVAAFYLCTDGEAKTSVDRQDDADSAEARPVSRTDSATVSQLDDAIEHNTIEQELLPDISPQMLEARPWLTFARLEATTPAQVLEGLVALHGDQIPEQGQLEDGDLSDGNEELDWREDAAASEPGQSDGRSSVAPRSGGSKSVVPSTASSRPPRRPRRSRGAESTEARNDSTPTLEDRGNDSSLTPNRRESDSVERHRQDVLEWLERDAPLMSAPCSADRVISMRSRRHRQTKPPLPSLTKSAWQPASSLPSASCTQPSTRYDDAQFEASEDTSLALQHIYVSGYKAGRSVSPRSTFERNTNPSHGGRNKSVPPPAPATSYSAPPPPLPSSGGAGSTRAAFWPANLPMTARDNTARCPPLPGRLTMSARETHRQQIDAQSWQVARGVSSANSASGPVLQRQPKARRSSEGTKACARGYVSREMSPSPYRTVHHARTVADMLR